MSDRLTVIATWARAVANALEACNCDCEPLFDELGIDSTKTYDPTARYPMSTMYQLLLRAIELSGDPAFSLKVSRHLPQTYLPALVLLVASSENMYKAFDVMCQFSELVNDGATLTLERDGDSVFLIHSPSDTARSLLGPEASGQLLPAVVEATFAGLVDNVRNSLNPQFSVKCVHFNHREPDDRRDFDKLFQAPIRYYQVENKLEFDYQLLCQPLITANPLLVQVNEQIVKGYLENRASDAMVLQTQRHILGMLPMGEPSQEQVARGLCLSSRQLRRKLQQADTSYSQLLQQTRHKLAKQYLAQPNLALSEITQLLGFGDQSNFSKAFKRWQGSSPGYYRQQGTRQVTQLPQL